MADKTYDQVCEAATAAAETRLLEHFKQHGGEVWTIGAGCQSCRQKLQDVSSLKRCANCDVALFCDRECQLKAWPTHKAECGVIATFQRLHKANDSKLAPLLEKLSWSSSPKKADDSKTAGVASSIGISGPELPGWFFTVDFESASAEQQKALYQAALELYGLLKDEDCWTRDKESFPRSSYTLVESLPHASPVATQLQKELVEMNGHIVLFSAWLQHPEPPATQSTPLEDRSFFGVVDSLLQISAIRDGVDAFMDARFS
ncbi:hypothetical protein PF005_g15850 [Phytophthora fragariae]|uniref:MYND-type domain-containing protein n=1 Tax=Phytophthora fragariae TaxID=53985 RepID=A0A6A3EK01_9STRA|nr:hypothetical protein PF003_g7183 [Phytophthora fragariae]KAE8932803.1 hypothetical protein PF009_g17172 [Phytophthora fragariae]KAE8998874.1 hypothetical protein PF011_g14867 [Phytophthora fragariae]KAE9098672.1 hypothetical protein PF007_g16173 [Phytophthora fragariae]KAE9098758.1 hypothetical protein PF010_g15438 [Phytophthora fragariae]